MCVCVCVCAPVSLHGGIADAKQNHPIAAGLQAHRRIHSLTHLLTLSLTYSLTHSLRVVGEGEVRSGGDGKVGLRVIEGMWMRQSVR